MEINTNSWHYQWLQFWNRALPKSPILWDTGGRQDLGLGTPQSLCTYIHALWLIPILVIIGLATAIMLTILTLVPFGGYRLGRLIYHIVKQGKTEGKPKQPSIVLEYVRARKKRVCPTLTYNGGNSP